MSYTRKYSTIVWLLALLPLFSVFQLQAQTENSQNTELATYELSTGLFYLPVVQFSEGGEYWVEFRLETDDLLTWIDYGPTDEISLFPAEYKQNEGLIHIPYATLTRKGNPIEKRFWINLEEFNPDPNLQFSIEFVQKHSYEITELESNLDYDASILIKNTKSDESIVVFGEKSEDGVLETPDGFTYLDRDGNSMTVFIDHLNRPTHVVFDGVTYQFSNYSTSIVDISVTDENDSVSFFESVQINSTLLDRLESSQDAVSLSLVISLVGCAINSLSIDDGLIKNIASNTCTSPFKSLTTIITDESTDNPITTTNDCNIDLSVGCEVEIKEEEVRSYQQDELSASNSMPVNNDVFQATADISNLRIKTLTEANTISIILSANIVNGSSSTISVTNFHFYLSDDENVDENDELIGSGSILNLQPNEQQSRSIIFLPENLTGERYFGACIESNSAGDDSSCTYWSHYTFVDPGAVVEDPGTSYEEETQDSTDPPILLNTVSIDIFSVSSVSAIPGQTITLGANVSSSIAEGIHSTNLVFYLSSDNAITSSDTIIQSFAIDLIDSGVFNRSHPYIVPDVSGSFHFGSCLENASAQLTVENICTRSQEVLIESPPNQTPELDLIAGELRTRSTLEPGEEFGFSAAIGSIGYTSTNTVTLKYYQSLDAVVSSDDVMILEEQVRYPAEYPTFYASSIYAAPDVEGTYYYYACLDVLPSEVDRNNNCSDIKTITVEMTSPPDLYISSFNVRDFSTTPHVVIFSGEVSNQGEISVATTTVKYYQSDDSDISSADTLIATETLLSLNAGGGSRDLFVQYNMPSEQVGYFYGACVDVAEGEIITDNQCSGGIYVVANDFDLPEVDLELSVIGRVVTADSGGSLRLGYELTNLGYATSPATVIHGYLSADSEITSDDEIKSTIGVGSVGGQDSLTGNLFANVPNSTAPGNYYFGACVDSTSIDENKTNDCGSVPVTITAPTPPDLTISSFSVSSVPASPGLTVTLTARIQNLGDGSNRRATINYYLSNDSQISSSDTLIGNDVVNPFFNFTTPEYTLDTQIITSGDFFIGACLEAIQGETNISNQCSTGVFVQVP